MTPKSLSILLLAAILRSRTTAPAAYTGKSSSDPNFQVLHETNLPAPFANAHLRCLMPLECQQTNFRYPDATTASLVLWNGRAFPARVSA